jgi:hypothetical protein
MGWGICFDLDANGRVYCADGCKWRATKADYEGYPVWPSARQSVLEYFEGEAHRELDMIRDECPGTASALAEACDEHIGSALRCYHHLSDEEKTKMHEETISELEAAITLTEHQKKNAYADYLEHKKAFKAYTPPTKQPKTRIEEIQNQLQPLNLELAMEEAARAYDRAKSELMRLNRELKLERRFSV